MIKELGKSYWYEPGKIKLVLLKELGLKMSYDDLKKLCNVINVYTKEDEIKKYLSCCVDANSGVFNEYDGYSLTYYKKYIFILKKKCCELFKIIDRLELNYKVNRDNVFSSYNESVLDIINKYDIRLDPVGKVCDEDIDRIIKPLVYNIKKLISLYEESNKLSTYFERRIDIEELKSKGIVESQLYPSSELQITNCLTNDKGYIPLTENQKNKYNYKELISMGFFITQIEEKELFKEQKCLKKELR